MVASDGAGEYDVVGESRAGSIDILPMGAGRIAYITTGEGMAELWLSNYNPHLKVRRYSNATPPRPHSQKDDAQSI